MCSLGNYILKIKRRALRIKQSFYTWSCVLGGAALWEEARRAQSWALLGTEAPAGPVCASDRRSLWGTGRGTGLVMSPRAWFQGPVMPPVKPFHFILRALGAIQGFQSRERHDQIDFCKISLWMTLEDRLGGTRLKC